MKWATLQSRGFPVTGNTCSTTGWETYVKEFYLFIFSYFILFHFIQGVVEAICYNDKSEVWDRNGQSSSISHGAPSWEGIGKCVYISEPQQHLTAPGGKN